MQQLQQHHKQQQQQPDQDRPITFEGFMELHPKHAETKLDQLAEISGEFIRWLIRKLQTLADKIRILNNISLNLKA